jgi:hypothetical protein|nr:hypothetical protein [Methylobacterium sp. ZNC0032]
MKALGRYGYSIFCDDIRNEVGGKLSFIGCYNSVMFVPAMFPFTLPKFCVHLHVVTPAHRPFELIVARCYVPGQREPIVAQRIEAPNREEQGRLVEELGHVPSTPRFIVAAASLIFAPLNIQEPGLISVRALVDDDEQELKIGSLRVAIAD